MARLTIVVEVDVDPTLEDPHEVVDNLLYHGRVLPTFGADVPFGEPEIAGRFISAEWTS